MSINSHNTNETVFEQLKKIDNDGSEYWSARDLYKTLEYLEYRNFLPVIQKAITACKTSGYTVEDHFVDVHEMVEIGSGAKRKLQTVQLSRYACYLIVQNADPAKEVVALGQTYFAYQTRKQEIREMDEYNELRSEEERRLFLRSELKRHNAQLADAAKNAGVASNIDYAVSQKRLHSKIILLQSI